MLARECQVNCTPFFLSAFVSRITRTQELRNFVLLFASEPSKRVLITETKNEVDATSVPQKPKLSKAERRAIQEAQRAAKAAAKEAGN
jgi:hypothetical protein